MYPFHKLTEKQRYVLGNIAFGCDGGHNQQTLQSLLKKGLIKLYEEEDRRGLGVLKIYRYYVPQPYHLYWCQWCSEHCTEEVD